MAKTVRILLCVFANGTDEAAWKWLRGVVHPGAGRMAQGHPVSGQTQGEAPGVLG